MRVNNPEVLEKFERDYLINDKSTPEERLKKYDALYRYAVSLGILPNKNPLEGIDVKIKVAKIVNGIK